MGFISRIFNKYAAKQMQDEDFGLITFKPHKAIRADYFVGCNYFSPLQQDVDFLIYAPKTGISAAQKSFYKEIENAYSAVIEKSLSIVEAALQQNGNTVKIEDFNREFEPYRLTIPDLRDTTNLTWTMEYKTIHDPAHHYHIIFNHHQAVEVNISPSVD